MHVTPRTHWLHVRLGLGVSVAVVLLLACGPKPASAAPLPVGPPGAMYELFVQKTIGNSPTTPLPPITCNGSVDYPHQSKTISGDVVVKLTIKCTGGEAAGGFLSVELWRTDESTSGVTTHHFVVSNGASPGPFKDYVLVTAAPCTDGVYQGWGSMELEAPPGYVPLVAGGSGWGPPMPVKCL